MDLVVAPFDQRYPPEGEQVSVSGLPGQIFNGPPAVTVGTGGVVVAVTRVDAEV